MNDEWRRSTRVRRTVHWAIYGWFRVLHGLRVEGLENLPAEGGCIVAGGPHVANLDIIMGVATGPKRVLRGMTKIEVFSVPVIGWFMLQTGAIPLDRKGGVAGLRAAIEALAQGDCIGIFPEGTRSKTGVPGRAKAGVGFLASRSGAPVVPVRMDGMRRFPFTRRVLIRFGPPLRFDKRDADAAECQAFSQTVLDRALSL